MIRIFIAVNIPESIRNEVFNLQKILRDNNGDIKWVRPESMHITLKFLGNVQEDRIDDIGICIKDAVKQVSPFNVLIKGTGAFPNDRRPRVLWVGIKNEEKILSVLAERIDRSLGKLDFKMEGRKFSAHLTLGRVRSLKNINKIIRIMHTEGFNSSAFTVHEVIIVKSELKPDGAVYTILKRIKLEG